MCKALEDIYNDGVQAGMEAGIEQGRQSGIAEGEAHGKELGITEGQGIGKGFHKARYRLPNAKAWVSFGCHCRKY